MEQCGEKGRVRRMRGWREKEEVSILLHTHLAESMVPQHTTNGKNFEGQLSVSSFELPSVAVLDHGMDKPPTAQAPI